MKKYTYILAFMLSIFIFAGCEKDETKVYISENPVAAILQSPATPDGLIFTKDNKDDLIGFTWTESDFGYQASISYGVQLSLTNDFASPVTIIRTQELTDSITVGQINDVLITMDLEIGVETTIKCRVFSTVGPNYDTTFSTATDFLVTPYETLVDYPMIYVPGAYQGWAPGDINGRLFSYNFNSVYQGIIRLNGGDPVEFKIAPAPNWDNSWGGNLTSTSSGYTGTLDPSGGNFSVAAGTYKFTVNTTDLTITLEKTDDWGIIGGAVPPYDWSVDVDLFYNGQRKMWEITSDFADSDIKFRANDGWDLNYGDTGADGSLETGGDNITLGSGAGNYTIRADFENLTYQIIKN